MSLQAETFYISYFLWKVARQYEVKRWVLKSTSTAEQKEEKMADLIHYLKTKADLHCFFCVYFTCELLNWVHIILEIYVITWFFGFHMENYVSEFIGRMEHTTTVRYSYFKFLRFVSNF